jgi:PKD repeat protein
VFTLTPSDAGDYTFDVVVSDGSLTDSETITVHVEGGGNIAPIASFVIWNNAEKSLVVIADAVSSSDPDGSIVAYAWTFGDGAVASGVNVTHTYATWGTWWITLTVTDNGAMTASLSKQVTVSNKPQPPPPPYQVFGYAMDSSLAPIYGALVTVTDLRTGAIWTTVTDNEYGYYLVDLNTNMTGWAAGDTVQVVITSGSMSGSASGVAGAAGNEAYLWLDIVLSESGLSWDDGYAIARVAKAL